MGLEWVHWCRKGRSQVVCYKETKQRMCFQEEGVANCLPGKMRPEARGHCVLERNSCLLYTSDAADDRYVV